MAKYSFNKEEFEAWKRAQQESADLQQKLNTSMKDYLTTVKQIGELQKNIKYIEQQISKLKKEQNDYEDEIRKNGQKIRELRLAGYSAASDEVKVLKKQNEEIRKLIAAKRKSVDLTEHELEVLKKQTAELTEQVKQVNALSLGFNTIVDSLGAVPGLIKKGYGMLKGTGIFEMDKEIRNATRSMAGGQKTYNNILNTVSETAKRTTMWGVGLKDLAVMQQGYSEAIGRSVMLTEAGAKAMAGIAEGTGLGKEFAVELAAGMDDFNISAERTGQIVEDNMNLAAKLGVNGAAAMKSIQNNLKLAQKYNFKGGIAGLAKFSVEATKLKLDLDGIAGVVDKVFTPEGAIELSAELSVMGGRFAALADPMQLLFKGRNDFEGFAKDIGKASAEFLTFNKETGEFEKGTGLAAHHMKVIAQKLGISEESLFKMGQTQARIEEMRRNMSFGVSDEDAQLVESMANFSKKKGGFVVNVEGRETLIKDLKAADMEKLRAEKKTLEERAEDARTFDETLSDLILQFKQLLLPFAQSLKEYLGGPIQELSKTWTAEGFYDTLKGFVQSVVDLIPAIKKFVTDNPITSGIIAGTAIFGGVLAKAAMWMANGVALGMGFNSVASVGGGGGGGSILDMLGGKGGKGGPGFMKNYKGLRAMGDSRLGAAKSAFKWSGGLKGMAGRGLGFLGSAGGAGLLSAGFAGYDEWTENSAMGMGTGENIGRTASKGGGAGAGALAGAAMGAWAGPIGMLIGGAIGGFAGSEFGEQIGDAIWGEEGATATNSNYRHTDYSHINDGIMFHPNDKFMRVNDAVTIAGTSTSGNNKLAQELNSSNMNGEVNHNFKDLNIRITVDAPTDSEFWRSVVNQPDIMRRITEAVHISTEEAASGKISGKSKRRFKA
jgi:hypothetical protein